MRYIREGEPMTDEQRQRIAELQEMVNEGLDLLAEQGQFLLDQLAQERARAEAAELLVSELQRKLQESQANVG